MRAYMYKTRSLRGTRQFTISYFKGCKNWNSHKITALNCDNFLYCSA